MDSSSDEDTTDDVCDDENEETSTLASNASSFAFFSCSFLSASRCSASWTAFKRSSSSCCFFSWWRRFCSAIRLLYSSSSFVELFVTDGADATSDTGSDCGTSLVWIEFSLKIMLKSIYRSSKLIDKNKVYQYPF